jgi:hypothetical protein
VIIVPLLHTYRSRLPSFHRSKWFSTRPHGSPNSGVSVARTNEQTFALTLHVAPSRSITLPQFMYEDHHGRKVKRSSRAPFTCGVTGRSYSAVEVAQRVDYLARSLAATLGFDNEEGTEWERVVGIFSYNSVLSYSTLGPRPPADGESRSTTCLPLMQCTASPA